jgi:hypothetical protein
MIRIFIEISFFRQLQMGKTKKQKNTQDPVVGRVKQSNTFKPHRKKTRSWKERQGISGATLEQVAERQGQYFSKKSRKALKNQKKKKNQQLKTPKSIRRKGQSAFNVLNVSKQSTASETFEKCGAFSEKESGGEELNVSPRKKRRTESGERVAAGLSSARPSLVGPSSVECGLETPSKRTKGGKTESNTESQVPKTKKGIRKQTSDKTPKGNNKAGETSAKTSKGNKKTGEASKTTPKNNKKAGETGEKTPKDNKKASGTSEKTPEGDKKAGETSEKPKGNEKTDRTSQKTPKGNKKIGGATPTCEKAPKGNKTTSETLTGSSDIPPEKENKKIKKKNKGDQANDTEDTRRKTSEGM